VPVYGTGAKRDLDLYMWTPPNGLLTTPLASTKAIVGPKESLWNSPGLDSYAYFGSLLYHPFARSFFDGGSGDPNPTVATAVGFETINIKQKSTTRPAPGVLPYYAGEYVFILTDGGSGDLANYVVLNGEEEVVAVYLPVISVWVKGARFRQVTLPGGCAGYAWRALKINGVTYTLGDTSSFCGDFVEQPAPGLWPYH
jgi:hypothetical protein